MRMATGVLCASLACAIMPAYASGGYIGVGAGMGSSKDATAFVLPYAGPIVNAQYDKSRLAFNVFAGYQFNKYVAAELEYVNFGTYSLTQRMSWGSYNQTDTIGAASVAAVGTWPITPMFSAFGKLGFADSMDKATESSYSSHTTTAINIMFGVGGTVNLTKHFALRLEYDQYDGIGSSTYDYTAGPFTQVAASALYMF
ncbi:MAG: outer membrane beta-barrel protein [Acidiferrobacter sp.]